MAPGINPIALLMQQIAKTNASQPMSEQPPGMPSPMAMPMPQMSVSPQIQQMQQQMQNQAQVFGQQPNATAGATQGPSKMPSPMMPGQVGQTEWATPGGRKMAITSSAIQSFSNAFQAGEQKNWERSASQAEQLWQTYSSMQHALSETQDPKAKQAIQQQLDQMMSDSKTQKILKKAHSDPTSAYGVGIQRAMQQSKSEAMDQAKLEEQFAKIQQAMAAAQANQAKSQAQQALAGLYGRKTELEGTATEKDKFQAQTKLQQQEMIKDSSLQKAKMAATTGAQRTQAMIQVAKIRADALTKAAQIRVDAAKKGSGDTAKYYKTQYDDLLKQLEDVRKQEKDVDSELSKRWGIEDVFGKRGDELRNRMQALESRRSQLQSSITDLNNRVGQLTGAGIIDAGTDQETPQNGEEPTDKGSGTEDDPIVVD